MHLPAHRPWSLLALALLLGGCAAAPIPAAAPAPVPVPDLAAFLERRGICDHLRGEFPDPPDPDRVRELEQLLDQYCTGTDAQLAALKARYRGDATVTRQLEAFEPRIESKAH